MKCGVCKTYDVSIEHVRTCSSNGPVAVATAPQPLTLADADKAGQDIVGYYIGCNDTSRVAYYKVQRSQTGNVYAKEWDGAEWLYCGRKPLYFLTTEDTITADDASRFGKVTGQCINCGRGLTDERSLQVGYGPTCAANNGWPWGEL